MKKRYLLLLLSGCTTAIGGASVLALAKGMTDHSKAGSVAGEAATSLPDSKWSQFPICHTAVAGATGAVIRLAAGEVQPGALEAARSAPEFADSDPPLWEGLGSTTYK